MQPLVAFKLPHIFRLKLLSFNFGPQHPAAHGVLRLLLIVRKEKIIKADPHIGFLHRGTEKLCEKKTFLQSLPYFNRLDYVSMLAQEHVYCLALEKLSSAHIPLRAQQIRVIFSEITRILNHLLGVTTHAIDVGAMTPILWAFECREQLFQLYEMCTGARMHSAFFRPGGLAIDVPYNFFSKLHQVTQTLPSRIDELENILTHNRIWNQRLKNIGIISFQDSINLGFSGVLSRSTGLYWDIRKINPYECYPRLNFRVPLGSLGDCYDRFLIRLEEMRQSTWIIDQILGKVEHGNIYKVPNQPPVFDNTFFSQSENMERLINVFQQHSFGTSFPNGNVFTGIEAPKGEFSVFLSIKSGCKLYRCKIKTPGLFHLQGTTQLVRGQSLSDLVTLIGSQDIVFGEIDR